MVLKWIACAVPGVPVILRRGRMKAFQQLATVGLKTRRSGRAEGDVAENPDKRHQEYAA
jgi:hypothetical protein